ncbi:unnamed protein product [Larinioides sclopetarius]|uniref:Uncharacterized protein n=1 Tax=Larinioides sclopetarius TaxID=280406 RepID=A0AAV2B3T2_9ARAC
MASHSSQHPAETDQEWSVEIRGGLVMRFFKMPIQRRPPLGREASIPVAVSKTATGCSTRAPQPSTSGLSRASTPVLPRVFASALPQPSTSAVPSPSAAAMPHASAASKKQRTTCEKMQAGMHLLKQRKKAAERRRSGQQRENKRFSDAIALAKRQLVERELMRQAEEAYRLKRD